MRKISIGIRLRKRVHVVRLKKKRKLCIENTSMLSIDGLECSLISTTTLYTIFSRSLHDYYEIEFLFSAVTRVGSCLDEFNELTPPPHPYYMSVILQHFGPDGYLLSMFPSRCLLSVRGFNTDKRKRRARRSRRN